MDVVEVNPIHFMFARAMQLIKASELRAVMYSKKLLGLVGWPQSRNVSQELLCKASCMAAINFKHTY